MLRLNDREREIVALCVRMTTEHDDADLTEERTLGTQLLGRCTRIGLPPKRRKEGNRRAPFHIEWCWKSGAAYVELVNPHCFCSITICLVMRVAFCE